MMAEKQGAAKEGAMKDIAECIGLFMRLSRNWCRLFLGWWLFEASKDWIPGQAVHADLRG